jgi:hypothetical protein
MFRHTVLEALRVRRICSTGRPPLGNLRHSIIHVHYKRTSYTVEKVKMFEL